MPISSFFKLIKRSPNDFEVIQIKKDGPVPTIPKYNFDKKKEGSNDMQDINNQNEQKKPLEEVKEQKKEVKKVKEKIKKTQKPPVKKIEEVKKEDTLLDDSSKPPGCNCLIL